MAVPLLSVHVRFTSATLSAPSLLSMPPPRLCSCNRGSASSTRSSRSPTCPRRSWAPAPPGWWRTPRSTGTASRGTSTPTRRRFLRPRGGTTLGPTPTGVLNVFAYFCLRCRTIGGAFSLRYCCYWYCCYFSYNCLASCSSLSLSLSLSLSYSTEPLSPKPTSPCPSISFSPLPSAQGAGDASVCDAARVPRCRLAEGVGRRDALP